METLSEDATISSAESELPDMVPVSIRSTLPELQHHSLEKVLAGLLLTWEEFLQLFDIRLDPNEYYIKGSNGSKSDLTQKIGDYVNSLKRKMKTYPVTLERVNGTNELSRAQRLLNTSDGSSLSMSRGVDSEVQLFSGVQDEAVSSRSATKKFKLIDGEPRSRNKKKTKETLEKIAHHVVLSQSPALKRSNLTVDKVDGQSESDSRSPTPSKDYDKIDRRSNRASTSSDPVGRSLGLKKGVSGIMKRKRHSLDHRQDLNLDSSSKAVKKPRKFKQQARPGARRSTNDESDSNGDSSDTDNDIDPCTKDKKKLLKQNVIKYLEKKVSPRSMLRLRNELMALREQEKYFKVTSVVPMTAGMMEQTFCRKLD